MKKLISLMLSVLLIFSLCMPVSAVRDLDPPFYEQCGYNSMEEMLADWEITEEEYYARVEEEIFYENWHYDPATGDMSPAIWEHEGYSSKEEYLADNGMTPEIYDEMVISYRVSYDWNYDESTGDMDPPVWKAYGYESKKALLKEWEITEDDYRDMVESERLYQEQSKWTDEQWEEYYAQQFQEEKNAMGLVYDINVMFRNQPLVFDDAVPEIKNDRVMVPLRAVMENMGAEVNYTEADRTAVIVKDDIKLTFVLGSKSFDITKNGNTEKVSLDSVPYIKNDRVFVPIRFVAESLGYDVFWSDEYRTGVYFDRDEIIAEFDKNYSVINSVLAMNSNFDLSKNYKADVSMDMTVKVYDSSVKNPSFTVGLDAVVLENQSSAKMTIEMDVASIIKFVKNMSGEDMDISDAKEILDVLNILNDDSIDMIFDLNKGVYYMRGNIFALVGDTAGIDIDSNTWIEIGVDDVIGEEYSELFELTQSFSGKTTVGELLYIGCTNGGTDYVYAYDSMEMMNGFAGYFADSEFKKSGSSYKYSLDLADLIGINDVCKLGATVTMKDGAASRFKLALDIREDASVVDIDFDTTGAETNLSGLIDIEDSFKLQFTASGKLSETAEAVPTAPPAGAKIISFKDLENIA